MTTLRVSEHGRIDLASATTEALADEMVQEVPPEFWLGAGCTVLRESRGGWTLNAGDSVGIARTRISTGDLYLQVRPKLSTADVFFMSDWAYAQRHNPLKLLDEEDVELTEVLRDPTACLLIWHARALRRFAARWLRRDYLKQTRVLNGKVKGKVLLDRYVADHLSAGDAASVPCRVQVMSQDNANNRLLKAGLRHIAALSYALPVPAARRAVLREANATLPLFGYVADVPVTKSLVRSTSKRGPLRHYSSILESTLALLENRLLGEETGDSHAVSSFMWHMPTLFQEFARGLLASRPEITLIEEKPPLATIFDSRNLRRRSSKVDPDLVIRVGDGPTLLIDTKYKDVLPSQSQTDGSAEDNDTDERMVTPVDARHRIKVTRADVYQAVAYRHHERWPGSHTALLFPVVLAPGDELPRPMQVRGFGDPVALLFIDVGRHASTNLPAFFADLQRYAETAEVDGSVHN